MELKAENVKNIRSLAVCKEFLRQAIEQNDQLNEELRHQKHKVSLRDANSRTGSVGLITTNGVISGGRNARH